MAQRLIKTPAGAGEPLQAGGRPLSAAHEQIVAILRSRLGQNHADLLAAPKVEADGGTAWSTVLAGPVIPAVQLPESERTKLTQRAERIVAEVRGLAQQLAAEGPASQLVAQMLAQSIDTPPGDWLYSVGGKPVMAMWGHAAPGSAAPGVAMAPPLAAAAASAWAPAASAATLATGGSAATVASVNPWPRRLAWALLALLAIAALLWGLKRCTPLPGADGFAERIAQAEAGNRSLEEEIARKRARKPQLQCRPDDPPPVAASAPEVVASAPADPPSAPEQRAEAPPPKNCPGVRPPAAIPDFVIVFDSSPSMSYSLNASKAEVALAEAQEERALAMRQLGLLRGPTPVERLMVEPHRMTPAREAAVSVARRVPPDMSIGLVMVDSCSQGARPVGMFPPNQRAALLARLRGVRAVEGSQNSGTPLADGLARAGRMIDGVKREATMLVISDGEESCKGDPCAVAAALARTKPKLRINVLDITGTGAGNCVAAATKGRVFTARNAAEVATMMRRAAEDAMAPADCKP